MPISPAIRQIDGAMNEAMMWATRFCRTCYRSALSNIIVKLKTYSLCFASNQSDGAGNENDCSTCDKSNGGAEIKLPGPWRQPEVGGQACGVVDLESCCGRPKHCDAS